eukprot:scaffold97592_cov75-Phaeocystis_antarctica.AAC.1
MDPWIWNSGVTRSEAFRKAFPPRVRPTYALSSVLSGPFDEIQVNRQQATRTLFLYKPITRALSRRATSWRESQERSVIPSQTHVNISRCHRPGSPRT